MRTIDKRSALPRAGDILPIVVKKTIWAVHPVKPAIKRGKLDYLGGPGKKTPDKTNGARIERIEKKTVLQGRLIGGEEGKITAFVMLDPEETPEERWPVVPAARSLRGPG